MHDVNHVMDFFFLLFLTDPFFSEKKVTEYAEYAEYAEYVYECGVVAHKPFIYIHLIHSFNN